MIDRGVVYMVWGEKPKVALRRSVDSVRRHHPELPVHVEVLPDDTEPFRGLLEKSRMFDVSPFQTTLFLDADTVVLGRLDFAFEKAERHGLACCVCECPWARRYGGLAGDLIEYNTGVLFFSRRSRPIFEAWAEAAGAIDSSLRFQAGGTVHRMPFNDQAGFARAVEDTGGHPFVLPLNWNFRPSFHRAFFGPLRIWHDYQEVPARLLELNARYASDPDAVIDFVVMTPA